MRQVRLFCQPVIRPAALLHELLDPFLCVHSITYPSVSILIPKRVL
nr:MAG TPA: hypothetical protein [Caudoviricetes sp.]